MARFTLEPTDKCNFRCEFCIENKIRNNAELDFDKAIEILDKAKNDVLTGNLVNSIQINGSGEPLLYKRLPELIIEAKKRFKFVEIITN